MKITKPMLASACKDTAALDFENKEYIATPKLDGIRALKIDGHFVSRTFKEIRNTHIRTTLEKLLLDGVDGEVVCPGAFQATSSGVMRESGEPKFTYFIFDYVKDDLQKPYHERLEDMRSMSKHLMLDGSACIKFLMPGEMFNNVSLCEAITSLKELKIYEETCVNNGFEGAILRDKNGPYKCGRATEKQQWLLKIKRFSDDEATIIGFGEKMHNDNPAEKDAFGRTKRSSHQENKRPAGTLGFLIVKDIKSGIEFEVGTGFDDKLRQEIWDNRKDWKNLMIKYKHFAVSGVKDKPRFPVYLGVRHADDMSD